MMEEKITVKKGEFGLKYHHDEGMIGFALVSKKRKQATYIRVCRDHISDDILSFVNSGGRKVGDIDMTRLRLLIWARKSKERHIFSAKHIINIYEDLAGFKTKSKIITAKYNDRGNAWLMTGPGEWMCCSQLVSMVTLIMRIVWQSKPMEPNNIEQLESSWRELIRDRNGRINHEFFDIPTYLLECYPKWRMIMENFYDLFDPRIEFYPKNGGGLWHSVGGVYELCRFNSTISLLDKKMKKLWKAEYKDKYKNG